MQCDRKTNNQMSKFNLTLTKDMYSHAISSFKWYFYSEGNMKEEISE